MNKKALLAIAAMVVAAVAIAGALMAADAPEPTATDTAAGDNLEGPKNHVINVTDSMEVADRR